MGEVLRRLEQSTALRDFLRARIPKDEDGPGCVPNCKLILEDLELNGRLTGWPKDSVGAGIYPVEGKLAHLILEFGELPPYDRSKHDELASVILDLLEAREG